MKTTKKLVVFTKTNARILHNPDSDLFKKLSNYPNVIINPNLERVDGVPPHFWKFKDGEVFAMDDNEKEARIKEIEKYGVDNTIQSLDLKFKKNIFKLHHLDWIAYGAIVGLLLKLIFIK